LLEEAGIPSVIIAVRAFRRRFEELRVARAILTPYIMGRPLGFPGDNEGQRAILLAAFDFLENSKTGGTILEFTKL
jgi:hypothetical protein